MTHNILGFYLEAGTRRAGVEELAMILTPWSNKRERVGSQWMRFQISGFKSLRLHRSGFKSWNIKAFGGFKYRNLKAFGGVKSWDLKAFVKNPAGD